MVFSKKARIVTMIGGTTIFFLVELIVGYWAHSLALVADAFHMANDIASLCVGYWAASVAESKASSDAYTYGVCLSEKIQKNTILTLD